ncbi:MAG: hypothetical protein ACFB0G_20545 [Leptolyngbyaceae cyanobacterium]
MSCAVEPLNWGHGGVAARRRQSAMGAMPGLELGCAIDLMCLSALTGLQK